MKAEKGIVLMNLGSPDSTALKDVKKYLGEFLMDGRVINAPLLLRWLLVNTIIVPFRTRKSAHAYRSIWTQKGSPLIVISRQVEQALQEQMDAPVEIAMRYGSPSPATAYDNLLTKNPGIKEVVLVPMYPHYAMSSYETAVEYAKEIYGRKGYSFKLTTIDPFYQQADYITALAESIKPFLEQEFDLILFSYHGIPERHILKSDITKQHCLRTDDCCETESAAHSRCYRHQTRVTTQLVAASLKIPMDKFSNSFQSRLGRDEWLKPYTAARLKELPGEGIKKLLVVCPAFVSDCLETLEEMAIEGKEIFMEAGGESFNLIPCLNVHPLWIKAIASWVNEYSSNGMTITPS